MPGVNVTTVTRSGPVATNTAPSGQVFMVGLAERGETTRSTLVRGLADFEAKFGGYVNYSHLRDNIATFFEEGGASAYVVRVVGPSATKGTLTLVDRTPVTPLSTIKLDAKNAGAWSSNLTFVVDSGGTTITVKLSGTTVETFTGTTVAAIVAAFADSEYVTATDLGSVTAAPGNLPAAGTFTMSAGTDDRASVTASHYEAGLALFDISLGDGAVAIPGIGATVHAALKAHASDNRRIALLSEAETASTSTLKSTAAGINSEFEGLFAPWVQISTTTGTRYTSPEGYVAGVRNRAHIQAGPWRAPAGQISVARSVIGLKYDYTRAVGDDLNDNKVNAIRTVNSNIVLYGWRSLSDDTANYSLLTGRDVLNRVASEAEARLEQYVFRTIDGKGQLLSEVDSTLIGILEPMRAAGGLFERYNAAGAIVDNGYLVETGPSVNSLDNLALNEVRARVSIRVSPSAALISVTIVKVGLLGAL